MILQFCFNVEKGTVKFNAVITLVFRTADIWWQIVKIGIPEVCGAKTATWSSFLIRRGEAHREGAQ